MVAGSGDDDERHFSIRGMSLAPRNEGRFSCGRWGVGGGDGGLLAGVGIAGASRLEDGEFLEEDEREHVQLGVVALERQSELADDSLLHHLLLDLGHLGEVVQHVE